MTQDELKKQAEKIEEIYQEYVQKMRELEKECDEIITNYIKLLEKAKIKEIRKSL
jgi:hypothetical protein